MTTNQTSSEQTTGQKSGQPALLWNGIHHIALITHDLDATINFYQHILEMVISPIAPSRGGRGRHCIILVNSDKNNPIGLHFFERPTAIPPTQPATLATVGLGENRLSHIALKLPDTLAANFLRDRLRANEVEITEITELGSFVFSDNNALLIEAVWPQV